MNGTLLQRLILETSPRLIAAAESQQVDRKGGRCFRQYGLVETPVLCVGAESMDQKHRKWSFYVSQQRPADRMTVPVPRLVCFCHAAQGSFENLGGLCRRLLSSRPPLRQHRTTTEFSDFWSDQATRR